MKCSVAKRHKSPKMVRVQWELFRSNGDVYWFGSCSRCYRNYGGLLSTEETKRYYGIPDDVRWESDARAAKNM